MTVHVAATVRRQAPILVTGVPRSGTTWLARLLATAPRTALAGREPMNPRAGQHALAHTVSEWTRLDHPTPRQTRALRNAYRGWDPRVYGRYGRRQWTGVLPSTRLVVKDPFAMLSVPTITAVTGARAVLLFRHPGASLVSYRRMGWRPDVGELEAVIARLPRGSDASTREWPRLEPLPSGPVSEARAMGWFWNTLHLLALNDLRRVPETVVVSHERLASGGPAAGARLFAELGLKWTGASAETMLAEGHSGATDSSKLHNFDRNPGQAAVEWRAKLSAEELAEIEEFTVEGRSALEEHALV